MAGALGYLLQQMRLRWKQFRDGYRPQRASIKTDRSPSKMMSASVMGCLFTLLCLALIVGLVALAYYLYVYTFG